MGHKSVLDEIDYYICELLEAYEELKKLDTPGEKSLHWFFSSFPVLANSLKSNKNNGYKGNRHALSILLVYLYMRLEHVHRRILRGAAIIKHKTDMTETEKITETFYLPRGYFYEVYKILTKKAIKQDVSNFFDIPYTVRNSIVHGRYMKLTEKQKRNAIFSIFMYSKLLSKQVEKDLAFKPFGKLEELARIRTELDKKGTKDTLKKLGIPKPREPKP